MSVKQIIEKQHHTDVENHLVPTTTAHNSRPAPAGQTCFLKYQVEREPGVSSHTFRNGWDTMVNYNHVRVKSRIENRDATERSAPPPAHSEPPFPRPLGPGSRH
ncbi:hypothetical protein VULLAG_LOCUS17662 [Vulpes lagopus]